MDFLYSSEREVDDVVIRRKNLAWMQCTALLALALGVAGCGQPGGGAGGSAQAAHPGEETYNRFCFSCHQSGIAGAPRMGDVTAWAPRIAKGRELLLANTKTGITPGMPAMGLCNSCTEQDLIDVIDYMILASSPQPLDEQAAEQVEQ